MTRLRTWLRRPAAGERGQTLVEMAIVLPITMMVSLGLVEVSYAILHQHVISRITREGANLISRDVSLLDATTAVKSMSTKPVDFTDGSQLILSVLKKGAVVGTANYDKVVAYLAPLFASRARDSWCEQLTALEVPNSPVRSSAEVLASPQAQHLGLSIETQGPRGTFRTVRPPLSFDGQPLTDLRAPPEVGQHNDELLGGL